MANTPYIQFFLTDVEVSCAARRRGLGDLHRERADRRTTTTGPDAFGGAKAVATNVFVRTPDGWRMWIHHASPVLSAEDDDDD